MTFQLWVEGGGDEDMALRQAEVTRGSDGAIFGLSGFFSSLAKAVSSSPSALGGGLAAVGSGTPDAAIPIVEVGSAAGQPALLGIKLWRGSSEPPPLWEQPGFDDSSWETVSQTPIGYPAQPYLLDDMQGSYTTFYVRIRFRLADHPDFDPDQFSTLHVDLGVDDGCMVYLDGIEIRRLNIKRFSYGTYGSGATVPHDETATRDNSAADRIAGYTDLFHSTTAAAGEFEPYIDPEAETVLGIQVLNKTKGDLDCVLSPRVLAHKRGPFVVRTGVDTQHDLPAHLPTTAVEVAFRAAPSAVASGTYVEYSTDEMSFLRSDAITTEQEDEGEWPTYYFSDATMHRIAIPGSDGGVANPSLPITTKVTYRVFAGGTRLHAEDLSFKTVPRFSDPVGLVVLGNTGVTSADQTAVASLLETLDADVNLFAGDFVIRNNHYEGDSFFNEYDEPALTMQSVDHRLYGPFGAALAHAPFYLAPGDEDLETEVPGVAPLVGDYDLSVCMPEQVDPADPGHTSEKFYSFDIGAVHVAVLQSAAFNFVKPLTKNMGVLSDSALTFLKQDLAATPRFWKIVIMHHPPYTSKETDFNDDQLPDDLNLRVALETALDVNGDGDGGFEELGVDLIVSAHEKFFERSHALWTQPDGTPTILQAGPDFTDPGAPVYVVTAGGGEPLWECEPGTPLCLETSREPFTDVMLRIAHVTRIDVDGNVLTVDAVGTSGQVLSHATITKSFSASFRRGDSNQDGSVNVADPSFTLNYLFTPGKPEPHCMDAADADDSGSVNLTDPIYTLNYLYRGGPPPPDPGPTFCGPDPTSDVTGCLEYLPECS